MAQKDAGSIVGRITDPSGALIAGAKVTISDVDRGTVVAITTNEHGEYTASPLKVGHYKVTVEKAGFKTTVAGPITVDVQEHTSANVVLEVGSLVEVVNVTTEGAQLETETSELGQVVNSKTINTLPLNGRNYAQLALLGTGIA
ncbi:MAG: carboxypeptidase regulatory-like domain-containing protein, partial [Acidobacteriales bacterium]|nr:carboxypeptidase regulatory-like domain-containing protein [Terriglobales bacterium]